jgi:threonylcarbamoyladenosine tRNA methylthiotransferase MtaB
MPCRSECPRQMTPAPLKYSIITFGCRVNQADSLAIARDLHVRGAVEASPQDAELVVVNTCSVTATADQGVRQTVRRVVRDNPGVRVIVTGCYATRRPDEIRELPNILHVVSNDEKDDLVERLASQIGLPRLEDVTTAVRYGSGDGPCGETLSPGTAGRTALTLRVQTGCDETCSYCIIPTTRGKGRSRPLNAVVRQIEDAVASGYREIAIAGVHLGSYGRDLNDGTSLTTLVRVLSEWDADVLFRISSLEPMDCTAEIVDLISSSPRLAPHFHLPLQHGSDEILLAMRRPYTASAYVTLVSSIRARIPHASIGSDLIVGFPGESSAHFTETESVLRDLPLTHLHVFPYSDRPGTDASLLGGRLDGAVVRDRGRRVRDIGHEMATRFRESQRGTTRRALTVDDGWSAVTDNYLKVKLDRRHSRNEWVDVRVD